MNPEEKLKKIVVYKKQLKKQIKNKNTFKIYFVLIWVVQGPVSAFCMSSLNALICKWAPLMALVFHSKR